MSNYNTTQLDPNVTFKKHVYHRDQFAHYLRWTHVLKNAKIGMNILDFGSGTGNMLEVFYRNKFRGKEYLGLDYNQNSINKAKIKFAALSWSEFRQEDLTKSNLKFETKDKLGWDIITSFEVVEHVGKENVDKYLQNIYNNMSNKTTLYLSTPCYDPYVGPAANHIVNGVIGELTYNEMKNKLEENGFKIIKNYGTFASIKDYQYSLNNWQKEMFENLREYYDTNLLSVIMAPFFPDKSRNCLWVCKK